MSEGEPVDFYIGPDEVPGVFTVEQSKDMSLDEFVDFTKYRVKDFDGLLIPDSVLPADFPEFTPEQTAMINERMRPFVKEFNERVTEQFRVQFIDQPNFKLFSLTRDEIERNAARSVTSEDSPLDGYRW